MKDDEYIAMKREVGGRLVAHYTVDGASLGTLELAGLRDAEDLVAARAAVEAWHGGALSWVDGGEGWVGRPEGWQGIQRKKGKLERADDAVEDVRDAADMAEMGRDLAGPDPAGAALDAALDAEWIADRAKKWSGAVGRVFRRKRDAASIAEQRSRGGSPSMSAR